jgi:hypothetical protein
VACAKEKMTLTSPKLNSLSSNTNERSWSPTSLESLINELDIISETAEQNNSLILFRGQTQKEWPIDSTFVRNCIPVLFNIDDYTKLPTGIRHRSTFHRAVASLLLMKFDQIIKPSQEAYEKEESHGIDPYFELLKNVQQYPEKYLESPYIKGTNYIDWTYGPDIALYFAIFSGIGKQRKVSSNDGALYVYDASSTGNIHQTIKMQQVFDNMTSYDFLNGEGALPLMLHPQKQTLQNRASKQKPVYITQMNFSFSLSEVWEQYEKVNETKVFLKIVINEKLKSEVANYLDSKGVTELHVYPN